MTFSESVWKRMGTVAIALVTTTALLAQGAPLDDGGVVVGRSTSGGVDVALAVSQEDVLAMQLERAHQAALAGDLETAIESFERVRASAFPWHSWAATSALVASHRMAGDFPSAFAVTAQVVADRSSLQGLMAIWDGDSAWISGDHAAARAFYEQATEDPADSVAAQALQQRSRLALATGSPHEAASLKRVLLRHYPEFISAELTLAEAMIFDAMATDQLPTVALSVLLHDEVCTEATPCVLRDGSREEGAAAGVGTVLAHLSGFRFVPTAEERALLEAAVEAKRRAGDGTDGVVKAACTPVKASDGFRHPMGHVPGGYNFMDSIAQGHHPGIDLNGPGGCNADCGTTFVAAARGCVRDASPAIWGSATIEHFYTPDTWVSQYGHARTIYYSVGAAITKGASLGKVGNVGTTCCHLHHELREADHPYRTNADYYSNSTKSDVGDWYQSPLPFHEAHGKYIWVQWADEGAFTRVGTWTYVSGVGNRDDMRWAPTTPSGSKTHYAQLPITARRDGVHELWAFIPYGHGTSSRAGYRVRRSRSNIPLLVAQVDQLQEQDAWVRIGSVPMTAGAHYTIEVASNTGEAGRRVALDDILLIKP